MLFRSSSKNDNEIIDEQYLSRYRLYNYLTNVEGIELGDKREFVNNKSKELGEAIYLSDLLIEPFVVKDTIVNVITPTLNDTIINEYHYDYRADLERMLCKYIIKGSYDTDNILANEGNASLNSLKYNYQMNIECSRKPASGFVGGGVKQLICSDMKNSQVKDNWNRVSTVWNDVYTNNGIIHILSPQHSFGFDEVIYVFNNYGNEYKK